MAYQFLAHKNKFWRASENRRRLWSHATGQDWCVLLYFSLPNPSLPFVGYDKLDIPYPGGKPPYTKAQYLASLGGLSPLPALPMYLDEYELLLGEAEKYLGNPYLWGGKAPSYFDCSGYVGWCYKETGLLNSSVVSYTGTLWRACTLVNTSEGNKPYYGDMVFWADPDSGTPDGPQAHVAIYIGEGDNANEFWTLDCGGSGVAYRKRYRSYKLLYGFYRIPARPLISEAGDE